MVRFEYEWGSGNEDDHKPRPCAIIIRGEGPRVFYFPISHEPPRDDDVALAIRAEARPAWQRTHVAAYPHLKLRAVRGSTANR